ncbi:hypothetical protein K469DRAFT_689716 [Zopfia rhizophila CBS 207.26]|uniref:ZZ-type domain-containing protein n=1 Tax=Zopfia rhizophila CBS 207.26 TaxID=1314779 RepID=A0A6A6E247_9PEZI|nr:hypothetical protein K469DRAFT_689716 [Zopfia rhizophila CBS 207.26]
MNVVLTPMTRVLDDVHFTCDYCDDGDFDLCLECYNSGARCQDREHKLRKYDVYLNQILPHNDKDFITAIPEFYTLNLNNLHGPGSATFEEALCECQECQEWLKEVCVGDDDPQFCIQTTTNIEDFEYHRYGDMDWPQTELQTRTAEERRLALLSGGRESWTMIMCISRARSRLDQPICGLSFLFPHSNEKRIFGKKKVTYTVRSVSYDDPSATDLSAHPGGIIQIIDSSEIWGRVNEYLSVCRQQHDACRQRDIESRMSGFYPTRVIDVGSDGYGSPKVMSVPALIALLIVLGMSAAAYAGVLL